MLGRTRLIRLYRVRYGLVALRGHGPEQRLKCFQGDGVPRQPLLGRHSQPSFPAERRLRICSRGLATAQGLVVGSYQPPLSGAKPCVDSLATNMPK